MDKIKDPLIVSALFFFVSSDWFDKWITDLFPSADGGSPIIRGLVKTAVFAGLYWLYRIIEKRN